MVNTWQIRRITTSLATSKKNHVIVGNHKTWHTRVHIGKQKLFINIGKMRRYRIFNILPRYYVTS